MAISTKADADTDVAEPMKAEVAALRADLADLGKLVARIGKQRAAGWRPFASLGLAALFGFLIGVLFRR